MHPNHKVFNMLRNAGPDSQQAQQLSVCRPVNEAGQIPGRHAYYAVPVQAVQPDKESRYSLRKGIAYYALGFESMMLQTDTNSRCTARREKIPAPSRRNIRRI